MQSLQTSFGMSFYEQACKILGEHVGYQVKTQFVLEGNITPSVSSYLERTLNNYHYIPNRSQEQDEIDSISVFTSSPLRYPDSIVDVFIEKPNGEEIYIDITTVKPNKKEFRTMKRKTLEWYALRKSTNPNAQVKPFIAIPYNPESLTTNNYRRHAGQYDRRDLLVGDELWMLASNNLFGLNDMNKIFQELGEETKQVVKSAFQ
ncbi:MjaII restriction endonuclease [Citrobacter youngae]|nr:MjaII restriction endonuclease [Citrobacter youngae]